MRGTFTIIDQGAAKEVEISLAGTHLLLEPEALKASLGWELKREGLCQGSVCIPESADSELVQEGKVNLNTLAKLTSRPLAVNPDEQAAYLGISAEERGAQLSSLKAPDFTLPDLSGNPHSLSEHLGKKVLLVAYSSW